MYHNQSEFEITVLFVFSPCQAQSSSHPSMVRLRLGTYLIAQDTSGRRPRSSGRNAQIKVPAIITFLLQWALGQQYLCRVPYSYCTNMTLDCPKGMTTNKTRTQHTLPRH